MMTRAEKKAWDNGFEAHDRGFGQEHNPFDLGPEHDAWVKGWAVANQTGGVDGLDQG